MITEIKLLECYQYRSKSGDVKCRVGSLSEDGKATLDFLTDGKWAPSPVKISETQLIRFLNQNGGKQIDTPEALEAKKVDTPEAAEAESAKPAKLPKVNTPKPEQTGPSTQDLCLGVLAGGPKTTGEAAKELGKPTAAVNSAMSALERAGKVSSAKGEADGKTFITWSARGPDSAVA